MLERGNYSVVLAGVLRANATGFRKHSFPLPVLLFLVFQGSQDGFRELASKVPGRPVVLKISSFLWHTVIITYPDLLFQRQLGRATMTGNYQYILLVSCIFNYVHRNYIHSKYTLHTYILRNCSVRQGAHPSFSFSFPSNFHRNGVFFCPPPMPTRACSFSLSDSCHGFLSFKYIFTHFSYSQLPHYCFLLSSHRIYMTFSRNIPPSSPSVA